MRQASDDFVDLDRARMFLSYVTRRGYWLFPLSRLLSVPISKLPVPLLRLPHAILPPVCVELSSNGSTTPLAQKRRRPLSAAPQSHSRVPYPYLRTSPRTFLRTSARRRTALHSSRGHRTLFLAIASTHMAPLRSTSPTASRHFPSRTAFHLTSFLSQPKPAASP